MDGAVSLFVDSLHQNVLARTVASGNFYEQLWGLPTKCSASAALVGHQGRRGQILIVQCDETKGGDAAPESVNRGEIGEWGDSGIVDINFYASSLEAMETLCEQVASIPGCVLWDEAPQSWEGLGKVYTDTIFTTPDGYLIYVHGGWAGQSNRGVLDDGAVFSEATAVPQMVRNIDEAKAFYTGVLGGKVLLDTVLCSEGLNKVMKLPASTSLRVVIISGDGSPEVVHPTCPLSPV